MWLFEITIDSILTVDLKETNVCSGQLQTDENFDSRITEIRC